MTSDKQEVGHAAGLGKAQAWPTESLRHRLLRSKEQRQRYRRIISTWSSGRLRRMLNGEIPVHKAAKSIVWAEWNGRQTRRLKRRPGRPSVPILSS